MCRQAVGRLSVVSSRFGSNEYAPKWVTMNMVGLV
jgi:hypothetical protein